MERAILSAIFYHRDVYDRLSVLIEDNDLSDKGKILYELICQYYAKDAEAACVDEGTFAVMVKRKYPKHADILLRIIEELVDVSATNTEAELLHLKIKRAADRLQVALLRDPEGANITGLMDEYRRLRELGLEAGQEETSSEAVTGAALDELLQPLAAANLMRLVPKSLNHAVGGGVPPGTTIGVFALGEVGKSLFSLNLAGGFVRQGLPVLYVGNEDPRERMIERLVCNLIGRDAEWVMQHLQEADAHVREKGYQHFTFIPAAPGSPAELSRWVEHYQPRVLIVDQVRNLDMGVDGLTATIEQAVSHMRQLAKRHGLVAVSVTQADDNSSGRLKIGRERIADSKVGFASQMDLLIGIGAQDVESSRRGIYLAKNKLNGNHAYFPVEFDVKLHKVRSLG